MKKRITFNLLFLLSALFLTTDIFADIYNQNSDIYPTGAPLPGGNYVTGQSVIAQDPCEIESGTDVVFVASDSISLNSGFSAKTGSTSKC